MTSELERHRDELRGYCRRLLRSSFDADDAVQETLVRAWRSVDRFDGRATLRSWLFRIATNVCFDMMKRDRRRLHPIEGPTASISFDADDPADVMSSRETVRLAFVAALRHLPPRQRAVLILRDVLRWKADEVAELLGTTAGAVNSALQRAKANLGARGPGIDGGDVMAQFESMSDAERGLLARYVNAFERYDVESLVSVAHDDATLTAPLLAAC